MPKKNFICLCAVAFIAVSASLTLAQQDLPSAKKVLARFVEKTGGEAKYKAIKNAKFEGEMSLPAANIKGKLQIVFVTPDKFHFKADLGEFVGIQERGSNGKIVWENSTTQGPRLIKGEEAEQMMQEISMGTILNPLKYYKSMKTTGTEKVNGDECYVVESTKKNGDVDKDFYSVESGLKVKSIKKVESPLGKIEVATYESKYIKANNGLLISSIAEQKFGPNSVIIKMNLIKFNTKVDESKFKIPADVKELIEE